MDQSTFDPTIKTTIEDINGPIESPGALVEDGTTFVLDRSIVILGCDEAADIRIDERSVAPYHAEISHNDGKYTIRHLDGSAPVSVGGKAVKEVELSDGDNVAIGGRFFTFRKEARSDAEG